MPPGFDFPNRSDIWLPAGIDPNDYSLYYLELLARLKPGVSVADASMGGGDGNNFTAEGKEPAAHEPLAQAWWRSASPDYFPAMGIRLLQGRAFQITDNENSLPVAIVDEQLARTTWPGESPIGKRIRWGRPEWGDPLLTVVGVVARVKHRGLEEDPGFYVYQPLQQRTISSMYVAVRTSVEPRTLVSALRAQVRSLDPQLPLFELVTMQDASLVPWLRAASPTCCSNYSLLPQCCLPLPDFMPY